MKIVLLLQTNFSSHIVCWIFLDSVRKRIETMTTAPVTQCETAIPPEVLQGVTMLLVHTPWWSKPPRAVQSQCQFLEVKNARDLKLAYEALYQNRKIEGPENCLLLTTYVEGTRRTRAVADELGITVYAKRSKSVGN